MRCGRRDASCTRPAATRAPTDAAIVLGAAVWRDEPSPVFAARIDYAVELLAAGHVSRIIFTGGLGGGDQLPEAEAAARYAVAHGANPDVLYCETISKTTWGNLVAAAAIMHVEEWQSATLVSDPLHLYRAHLMAQDWGIPAQLGPTPYSRYRTPNSQVPFLLREVFFVYQYHLQRLFSRRENPGSASIPAGICSIGVSP